MRSVHARYRRAICQGMSGEGALVAAHRQDQGMTLRDTGRRSSRRRRANVRSEGLRATPVHCKDWAQLRYPLEVVTSRVDCLPNMFAVGHS